MSNYRSVMCGEHKEGTFYLMAYTAAEERGGSSKPSGLYVADKIEDLPHKADWGDTATLYEVRNGALFVVKTAEDLVSGKDKGKWVVQSTFDPDRHSWWDIWEDGEEREDEIPDTAKCFVVVLTTWDIDGSMKTRQIALTPNWTKAFGNLINYNGEGSLRDQIDVFRLEKGQARLVASTASIECFTYVDTTGFSQYDHAINPYSACAHKCAYCYAGIYKDYAKLPRNDTGRVVIGTHTDPYQPAEAEARKTEKILRDLAGNKEITKVGIFTKSPLILRDIDLIKELPNPHVHINLSPFSDKWRTTLEGGTVSNAERLSVIEPLHQAGIKVVLNICPCIPGISDEVMTDPILVEAYKQADEICIGLLCLYGDIQDKMRELLPEHVCEKLLSRSWEEDFIKLCRRAIGSQMDEKLVIWRDRTRKGWKRLKDLTPLPQEFYAEHKSVIQSRLDDWLARQYRGYISKEEMLAYGERFGGERSRSTFKRGDMELEFVGTGCGADYDEFNDEGNVVKLVKYPHFSDARYLVSEEEIRYLVSEEEIEAVLG